MQTSYKVVEIQDREIIISSKATKINISTDMNAEKLVFKMPRYYNDLDLTSLDLVLYIKGVDVSDILAIRGYEVVEGYVIWEFVPQGAMLLKSGYIDVQVTGVQIVNNTLEVKWQTKVKENAFYVNNTLVDVVETVVKPLPTELEQYRAEIVRLIESVNLDDVVMDITADTENVLVLHRGNGTHSNVALNVGGGITLEEVNQVVNNHNASLEAHQDVRVKIAENTTSINANTIKITENANKIGDLSTLTTTQKGSLVGAINEQGGKIGALESDRGYLNSKIDNSNDLNLLTLNGKYDITGSYLNLPSEFATSSEVLMLDVTSRGGNFVKQIITATRHKQGLTFIRSKDATNVWSSWVKIATTDKIDVLLENGFQNLNGYVTTKMLAIKNGNTISINAILQVGTSTSSTVIGRLPVGFRPSVEIRHPQIQYASSIDMSNCIISITGSGDIALWGNATKPYMLFNISFNM